jgi:hypothetical protein
MAVIPASQARAMFTQALIATYKERVVPTNFLRSYFPTVESATRYLNIEVMRGTERIAVDVMRGSEGNRNRFEKSTEKIIEPPYYREYFDLTELDLYNTLFGQTSIDGSHFGELVRETAEKMSMLVDKIERAYELQCAQALTTGIVTVEDGTNIDYKRKAGSLVDLSSSAPWTTGSNSPYTAIENGANFIRQTGKSQGGTLDAIMGSKALNAFLSNTTVLTRNDIKNIALDNIQGPQRTSIGAALHGSISAGSYIVNIWSYNEGYENSSGVFVPYIDPTKVILVPPKPNFKLGFAAVPQLIDEDNPVPVRGAYVFGDYKDKRNASHIYDVKSAGVAIPVAVDQIYTMKVVAS